MEEFIFKLFHPGHGGSLMETQKHRTKSLKSRFAACHISLGISDEVVHHNQHVFMYSTRASFKWRQPVYEDNLKGALVMIGCKGSRSVWWGRFLLQAVASSTDSASSTDEVCNILLDEWPIEAFSGQTNNVVYTDVSHITMYLFVHKWSQGPKFGKTISVRGPDLHLRVPSFSRNNFFHS